MPTGPGKSPGVPGATPRIANRLLKRVRDYAQVRATAASTGTAPTPPSPCWTSTSWGSTAWTARSAHHPGEYDGGPVGLGTLAAALCEEEDTLEDVYEPI